MTVVAEKRSPYVEWFGALQQERGAKDPSWLTPLRERAIAHFEAQGFPSTKREEWRFTDVSPIAETTFVPAEPSTVQRDVIGRALFGHSDAFRLVFVNGRFAPELSSDGPPGGAITLASIAQAASGDGTVLPRDLASYVDTAQRPFASLNTALFEDGAVIRVRPGAVVEQPVHVLFLTVPGESASIAHPRVYVHAGENSQITVIEGYCGAASGTAYFNNTVTELIAGDNAVIDHYRLQQENENAFHLSTTRLHQGRGSTITSHSVTLGGQLVRNDVHATLDGEGADCTLNGLFVETGVQHVDNHLRVEHASPHTRSWEYYKGILADKSSGVFTGRIFVHPGAQKTDAKQTNMNLLLSESAHVNTKPQLEIFADDVKCTHGATIGQLDANAMFYLRSRGLSKAAARDLLIYAFASESIQQIKLEAVREELERILFERLSNKPTGR